MKIRKGFISNSSSSSFVVISRDPSTLIDLIPDTILKVKKTEWDENLFNYEIEIPIKDAQMEFDWQFERYYSFGDKLNFAIAQLMPLDFELSEKYKGMLRKVLRKHTEHTNWLDLRIDYNYFYWDSISDDYCHVDHQSAYYEYKPTHHEIFKDEDILEAFLFNTKSFIQCGNDNEDPTEEWEEAEKLSRGER